jgi:hypothetical protein
MEEAARTLAAWSDFYVIVGSSAAALTGLQFVVIALVNDMRQTASEQTISAFSTPTVVHFAMALLTSAIVMSPWPALGRPAYGEPVRRRRLIYQAVFVVHEPDAIQPVLEDWIWHISLPMVARAADRVGGAWFGTRHWRHLAPPLSCCWSSSAFTMPGTP